MKKIRIPAFLILVFLSVIVLYTANQNEVADAYEGEIYGEISGEFVDDRVVIVLTREASMNFKTYTPEDFAADLFNRVDDSTALTMELVKKQLEAEETGDWSELQLHVENAMLVDVENFRRILDLTLKNPGVENVLTAIEFLKGHEDVFYAGPDYLQSLQARPTPLPSDYYYRYYEQNGDIQLYSQNEVHELISLPHAWNISTGSLSVMVGVIDTGIAAGHPSLSNRIHPSLNRDFTDDNFPNGLVTNPPQDTLGNPHGGHGTAVAGIIGANTALTGNNQGVVGVNWNVTLVSLMAYSSIDGNGYSRWTRRAVDFATNQAIPILNHSGGWNVHDFSLQTSITNYPGLYVTIAGNNASNNDAVPFYPSNYNLPNLISVGASNIEDVRTRLIQPAKL